MEPSPEEQPEICPRCKKGGRIFHEYEFGGITRRSDYCGVCGKTWPVAKPKAKT